jgi:hypothetical protein
MDAGEAQVVVGFLKRRRDISSEATIVAYGEFNYEVIPDGTRITVARKFRKDV